MRVNVRDILHVCPLLFCNKINVWLEYVNEIMLKYYWLRYNLLLIVF